MANVKEVLPVAWFYKRENGAGHLSFKDEEVNDLYEKIPLYTHPAPSQEPESDYVFVCKHCGDKLGIKWDADVIGQITINKKEENGN